MKYAIYARVSPKGSSWDASDTSINMQVDYCREYIKFHGGDVAVVVQDEFFSGKDTDRPGFKKLLFELESGRAEWDALIVYKLSRMTRSLRDGADIFSKLFAQGKGFVSATERLDFSTPSGRAMLGVMQVFNQFEREQTAENIRNKMINMASRGLWPCGYPPFGYRRGEKKDNNLYVDPRKAEIVRDIFTMYASPNFNTIDILTKYRGTVSKTLLFEIINNQTYLGKICYAGNIFDGHHERLISQALWDAAQSRRPQVNRQSRPNAQKYSYLLTGLLMCTCGKSMRPASAAAGKYHYYVCTDEFCKNRIKAEAIEANAVEKLAKIEISDEFIAQLRNELESRRTAYLQAVRPELEQAQRARAESKNERDKLYRRFLETDDRSGLSYINDRLNFLTREIDRLDARIEMLNSETKNLSQFNIVEREIDRIVDTINFYAKIDKTQDREELRRVLLANIDHIQCEGNGDFRIVPSESSPKCTEWWR